MQKQTETNKNASPKQAEYFIQTFAIKEDSKMTRIYSAIGNPNFFNQRSENRMGMENNIQN
jgi:hypothetical protein